MLNFIPNTVQVYIGGYAASDYSKKLCLLFNNQIVDHEISKSVNVIDYLNLPNETFFTKNVKDYRDGYAVVNQQTKWTYYGQVTKTKQSVNIDNGTHFDGYYDLFIPNGFGIGILEEFYYEGYWENGLPNGVGVLMKKGSDFKSIQIGVFKNGEISEELESKKIIFYLNNPDLEIYTGKWSSKIPNTSQTQQVNAVGSFEGTFINENSKENFKGRMLVLTNGRLEKYYGQSNFTNGATFEGYWKSNSELLSGKLHFGNGIFYQGDFGDYSNYERAGMKIITTKNGQYHYDNGDIYIGEIKEGIIAGNGKLLKSDGTVKEGIWNNNQLIIDQNSSVYNSASKYSGAMKDVYLFDNGQYLSSLRNGMLNHSDPGGIQFSGKLNKDESTITVCYIGATANNVFYETDDCVYLESFQVMGNYIELGFKGSIRKRQNHYRIENTRDSNGKIKREFQRDEATYESMTFRLVINTTLQGNPYSFNFCFVDSNGRPDCGMGYYRGSLSYKE